MSDQWTLHGVEYGNCNCDYGCPCQFNAPTTHGSCEALTAGEIHRGSFNDTTLDGLRFALLLQWPGEIADGNGREQVIIDERADPTQREALRKILHGESTAPGATHFFVYNSTMSDVLETLYRPIDLEIDVRARRGRVQIPGLVESTGSPIIDPHSGDPHDAAIHLPNGFEYTTAWMGSGSTRITGDIEIALSDTYGQFNELHLTQDGVIR
jgi:hypothetical protein